MTQLLVRRAGFLTTVQDLGRSGHRRSGVSTGGALDSRALRVINLLVGNEEGAAGLEVTRGTLCLRCPDERLLAWAGGAFMVEVGGRVVPAGRAALVRAGEEITAIAPARGARIWLALSGGIAVPEVLGSRSTDLRSQFGGLAGRALRDGDELPLGPASARSRRWCEALAATGIAPWLATNEWSRTDAFAYTLRCLPGPEWSQFSIAAQAALAHDIFTVAPDSNRMGARLIGTELRRETSSDLTSEPVAPGTLQVPPDGQPILLLGDCQTIGGYPRLAHIVSVDLAAAAQLQPGDAVRFLAVTTAEAERLLFEQERDLDFFRAGLMLH